MTCNTRWITPKRSTFIATIGYVEAKFLKDFTFNARMSYDQSYGMRYISLPKKWGESAGTEQGMMGRNYHQTNTINAQQTLNWGHDYGKHHVDAIIVHEFDWMNYQNLNYKSSLSLIDGFDTFANFIYLNNGGTFSGVGGGEDQEALEGYFGRANYIYDNKYYLTASIRADGSSRFGKNNRYGYFPSGSVAWRLSQEDFLKDVKWLSDMKIRASYGITGNNNIGDYASIGIMENANYVLGTGTGNIVNGAAQKSFSNADLTWEKTRQTDLGFEISVLDSRLSLSLDLYYRKTTDLLMDVDIPTITGFEKAMQNIGKMRNKGLEITLSGTPFRGKDFTWDATGNISVNRNKVLALGPTGDPIFSDGGAGTTHVTMVGQPIGAFYGYILIWPTRKWVTSCSKTSTEIIKSMPTTAQSSVTICQTLPGV